VTLSSDNQDQSRVDPAPLAGSARRNARSSDLVLSNDQWCFVCGSDNPVGLHTVWRFEEGLARARFQPQRCHQGWSGVVHGGILASLLDEAMAQRLRFAGIHAVTAGLSIRYRKPVAIGGVFTIEARIVSERSRVVELASWVRAEDGACLAEAEGTCVRMKTGK
jgi:uncharacterized protein (TIGR00369 family)